MRWPLVLVLSLVLLVGCGGAQSASAPAAASVSAPAAETHVSANATDSPESMAQQLVTALVAQDQVGVLSMFDTGLPTRNAERERLAHDWTTRQQPDSSGLPCPTTLGPLKGHDFGPVAMNGETATVRVTLHHEKGDAWLDVSLRQTPDGWRVIEWSSRNICPGMK